jgi:hypothetical protein
MGGITNNNDDWWNIVVHGVGGATGVLHDNQMIGHGLMSFGAANKYNNGQGKVACM